ncbi:hypothetical protein SALBM217S_10223 [Streptomyces griseoloalbus]
MLATTDANTSVPSSTPRPTAPTAPFRATSVTGRFSVRPTTQA